MHARTTVIANIIMIALHLHTSNEFYEYNIIWADVSSGLSYCLQLLITVSDQRTEKKHPLLIGARVLVS